VFINRCSGYT